MDISYVVSIIWQGRIALFRALGEKKTASAVDMGDVGINHKTTAENGILRKERIDGNEKH